MDLNSKLFLNPLALLAQVDLYSNLDFDFRSLRSRRYRFKIKINLNRNLNCILQRPLADLDLKLKFILNPIPARFFQAVIDLKFKFNLNPLASLSQFDLY